MVTAAGQPSSVNENLAVTSSTTPDPAMKREVWFSSSLLGRGILLAILNVLVFAQSATFQFVNWDDIGQVMNRVSQFEGLSSESLHWAMTNHVGGWMTPVTWITLLFDRQFFGSNAGGYHLTNVLLHIATSWFLFAALSRLTGQINRSFIVACLFSIHPLHVEPVAWVTGRWELVAGLFWSIALLLWSFYVRSRSRWTYIAVIAAYVAAVLGKPIALTFPFVLLLLDFWPLNRFRDDRNSGPSAVRIPTGLMTRLRTLTIEKVPLFLALIILSMLAIVVKRNATQEAYTEQFPFLIRIGNAVETYFFYLWKTLWPHDLACFYPHPASIGQFSWTSVAAAASVIAAITILSLITALRCQRLGFLLIGWLYYLGTFVPASGIIQVELYATADRYTYIPLIGLLIMLVWGCSEIFDHWRIPTRTRSVAVTVCLALLVVISFKQCGTWRDSNTLWTHAANVRNSNYRAHSVLAYLASKRGDLQGMEFHSQQSFEICPQYVHGPSQLGLVRLHQRRPQDAAKLFRLALRHAPGLVGPRIALGRALREAGQLTQSTTELELALSAAPSNELAARELALTKQALANGRTRIQRTTVPRD